MASFSGWIQPALLLGILASYYFCMVTLVDYRLSWTPPIQLQSAPENQFSEARAFKHVDVLCTVIGHRQVSTPGRAAAARYLLERGDALAAAAQSSSRVYVEVSAEHVSGAVNMDFVTQNFTNVYVNLTNIIIAVYPRLPDNTSTPPGLLIASHYDSGVSSIGAADDASQVAVMLEAARVLVHEDKPLAAPVVFLFSGGEETISQAAHGFMTSSPYAKQVGAFMNLEALGSGGLPNVFQHSGWVVEAYAAGAPHARGSRVAQDVFDLKIIPADSDYRMFSESHYGHLPGIDIAYVGGSKIYHTHLDTPEGLKPGMLQEMGENVVGAVGTMTAKLAEMHQQEATGGAANSTLPVAPGRAVFHDLGGMAMVTMSDENVRRATWTVMALLLASVALVHKGGSRHDTPSVSKLSRFITGAQCTLYSLVSTLLACVLMAGARVWVTGIPMIWYDQQWVAYAIFQPVALCGVLFPWYAALPHLEGLAAADDVGHLLMQQIHGAGFTVAIVAFGLGLGHLMGLASLFCASAWLCLVLGHLVNTRRLTPFRVLLALALAAPVLLCVGTVVGTFIPVLMERMSLTGYMSMYLADVVVGALQGLCLLAFSAGAFIPLVAAATSHKRSPLFVALLVISLSVSLYAALFISPYSPSSPKRLMFMHLHRTSADISTGTSSGSSSSSPCTPAWPCMQVDEVVFAVGASDSTPLKNVIAALPNTTLLSLLAKYPLKDSLSDFAPTFPLDILLEHMVLRAPPASQPLLRTVELPHVAVKDVEELPDMGRHLSLALYTPRPAWMVINITGPLTAWSFSPALHPTSVPQGPKAKAEDFGQVQHIIRLATEADDPEMPFWLESVNGTLRLELTASYLEDTDITTAFVTALPPWVTSSFHCTTYQSVWEL